MKQELKASLKSFLLELLVYAAMVAAYYGLVLHFLGRSLQWIYKNERHFYAGLALGLIVAQGLLLELLTRLLLAWIKPRSED